jgi:hypothetical protein
LTEHLVFANRLHGLKVDINVVWTKKHGTVSEKFILVLLLIVLN